MPYKSCVLCVRNQNSNHFVNKNYKQCVNLACISTDELLKLAFPYKTETAANYPVCCWNTRLRNDDLKKSTKHIHITQRVSVFRKHSQHKTHFLLNIFGVTVTQKVTKASNFMRLKLIHIQKVTKSALPVTKLSIGGWSKRNNRYLIITNRKRLWQITQPVLNTILCTKDARRNWFGF